MTETLPDKIVRQVVEKREGIHPSGGVFDKDRKQFVPTPKTDRGARFYVTPAGITNTKKGNLRCRSGRGRRSTV
jgi:hypothetical protein